MRGSPNSWLLLVPMAATLACSDGSIGPGELTQADLVGTWNVTRLAFREKAPGPRTSDAIRDGGGTGTVTIEADGDYTLALVTEDGQETWTGTVEVTDEGVVETREGESVPRLWLFTLDGKTLTATTDDAEFDFDQDDGEEDASVTLILQRAT